MTIEFKTARIFPMSVRNFTLSSLTDEKIEEIINIIDNECTWDSWTNEQIRGSWTKEQNILQDPRLKDVLEEVTEAFNIFKTEENHICGDIKVICSWGNKLENGEHIVPHMHANAYLASAIHLSSGSNIVFQHPTVLDWCGLDFNEKDNLAAMEFPIEKGHMIVFPSKLVHGVKEQTLPYPRYSLGVNAMPINYGRPTAYVDFRMNDA